MENRIDVPLFQKKSNTEPDDKIVWVYLKYYYVWNVKLQTDWYSWEIGWFAGYISLSFGVFVWPGEDTDDREKRYLWARSPQKSSKYNDQRSHSHTASIL